MTSRDWALVDSGLLVDQGMESGKMVDALKLSRASGILCREALVRGVRVRQIGKSGQNIGTTCACSPGSDSNRLATLLDGHERAFRWFGGLTFSCLYDNPRTLLLGRS